MASLSRLEAESELLSPPDASVGDFLLRWSANRRCFALSVTTNVRVSVFVCICVCLCLSTVHPLGPPHTHTHTHTQTRHIFLLMMLKLTGAHFVLAIAPRCALTLRFRDEVALHTICSSGLEKQSLQSTATPFQTHARPWMRHSHASSPTPKSSCALRYVSVSVSVSVSVCRCL